MTIVEQIHKDLADRQAVWVKKYGQSMDDSKWSEAYRLQHAYEELLDGAMYIKKLLNDKYQKWQ